MKIDRFRWSPETLKEENSQWIIELPQPLIDHVRVLEISLEEGDLDLLKFKQLSDFKKASSRLKDIVHTEVGVAVLKCGPRISDDQARFVQIAFGSEFGENVTSTPYADHRPLFALEAKPDPTCNGRYQGSGLKNDRIGFHTDASGSDKEVSVVSMLCIRPARFGGQCRLSNSLIAFARLPQTVQDVLYRPYPRADPDEPGRRPAEFVSKPIFKREKVDPYLAFSYHPKFLKELAMTNSRLTDKEKWAFSLLEKSLEEASCEINLMPHEILFINNQVIAHDRREFWDEANSSRLLERFWAEQNA